MYIWSCREYRTRHRITPASAMCAARRRDSRGPAKPPARQSVTRCPCGGNITHRAAVCCNVLASRQTALAICFSFLRAAGCPSSHTNSLVHFYARSHSPDRAPGFHGAPRSGNGSLGPDSRRARALHHSPVAHTDGAIESYWHLRNAAPRAVTRGPLDAPQ